MNKLIVDEAIFSRTANGFEQPVGNAEREQRFGNGGDEI